MTRVVTLRSDRAVPTAAPAGGLARRAALDGLGTAFLLATIVGSGVMGERLAGGSLALALLANSIATGAGLVAIILTFGAVSGAHLNPIVTLVQAGRGALAWADAPAYLAAQAAGALAGVAAAHAMFGLPILSIATRSRSGPSQVFAELVATLGLVLVVLGSSRLGLPASAAAVGCYIAAAYWFTSSTSFANPAVTLGRALSDTFVGIRPRDVPGFLAGQAAGGAAAFVLGKWLMPSRPAPPRRKGEPLETESA